jgi:hypothetical protein
MNAVKVQYTVKAEYAETNKKNIARVMNALREINSPNIRYSSFLLDDGKTFVHFVMRTDEEAGEILSNLEAFKDFQQQLRNSEPESPPKAENLTLVDASWDVFPQ